MLFVRRIVSECKPSVDKDNDDDAETRSSLMCDSKMAELENAVRNLKQKCCKKLTTKSYQLKIQRTKDDDLEEYVREFYETETQSVLDKLKLIRDQWRKLDFWKLLQSVNPRPIVKMVQEPLGQTYKNISENPQDQTAFERSIVLCCIFEDLMRNLGWKVGDTLDIETDICNTIGKLMMQVAEQDRSSLLDCMQSAMLNIQAHERQTR